MKILSNIPFGKIRNFEVSNGIPRITKRTILERSFVFSNESDFNTVNSLAKPVVRKKKIADLYSFFRQIDNGKIDFLQVKNGVPYKVMETRIAKM